MALLTALSALAMVLGLGGILPHLARMVRTRSAAGHSPVGWGMGLIAQLSMAYVNGMGFESALLCTWNLTGAALCACALGLIVTLGRAAPPPAFSVHDMATQELRILREAVVAAEAARS